MRKRMMVRTVWAYYTAVEDAYMIHGEKKDVKEDEGPNRNDRGPTEGRKW